MDQTSLTYDIHCTMGSKCSYQSLIIHDKLSSFMGKGKENKLVGKSQLRNPLLGGTMIMEGQETRITPKTFFLHPRLFLNTWGLNQGKGAG